MLQRNWRGSLARPQGQSREARHGGLARTAVGNDSRFTRIEPLRSCRETRQIDAIRAKQASADIMMFSPPPHVAGILSEFRDPEEPGKPRPS
jgi:hypothetical protein